MFIIATVLAGMQAATPAATPAAGATLQQRFDAANKAQEENRCAEAVVLYAALENEPRLMRNPRAAAAVALRKGVCQLRLGQDEGEAAVRRGLPLLDAAGPEFAIDVRRARVTLGEAALQRFDTAAAIPDLERALAGATGLERIRPLMGLSRATMFDGDGVGVRYAEEALRIASEDSPLARKQRAVVRTQYARALLNAGRNQDAYRELKTGLKEQGGLTLKVNASDIATRSDLAIAAQLSGDEGAARNYLAYTGAGRMADSPFGRAQQLELPACGGEAGLKPDDMAVVEFSIADDGHVIGAAPVYTRAGRAAAAEFARAVAGWSWAATDVAKIPVLFRYTTRVELRCTRAAERPDIGAPLAKAAVEWAEGLEGTSDDKGVSDAVLLPAQRAAVERARAAGDPKALIVALARLASNAVVPDTESAPMWTEAVAAARAAGAPAAVRGLLAIREARAKSRYDRLRDYRATMRALLADPTLASDPLTAATLRFLVAQRYYRTPPPGDAPALLDAIIAEPALPAKHPLKVGALLERANALAAAGDLAAARATFERTGLTEEQCALIEPRPVVRRNGGSSADYPMAAIEMGFEGWVRVEFDIARDGKTVAQRATAAYPPFVFNQAAEGILRDSRYTSSYRPTSELACSANAQSITFSIPR
jgi:hypothetical protein